MDNNNLEINNSSDNLNNEPVNKEPEKKVQEEKKKEKNTGRVIVTIILWGLLLVWVGICITDYVLTVNDKAPKFCLKKVSHKYDDGKVEECVGLGYKVYKYDRTSYKAIQFGPFWIDEHQSESN